MLYHPRVGQRGVEPHIMNLSSQHEKATVVQLITWWSDDNEVDQHEKVLSCSTVATRAEVFPPI